MRGRRSDQLGRGRRPRDRAALRVPGTVALPQPDGGRECAHDAPRGFRAALARGGAAAGGGGADRVFPGHGIDVDARWGACPSPAADGGDRAGLCRKGVAAAAGDPGRADIVAGCGIAAQLLAHVRRFVAAGGAVILISHILPEILDHATRIVVMKDGRVVADRPAAGRSRMRRWSRRWGRPRRGARAVARAGQAGRAGAGAGLPFRVEKGEVVGLTGLAGHGQTELLRRLHGRLSPGWWEAARPAKVAFVAGDRRSGRGVRRCGRSGRT
jgi:ribose transport system ATP-binding protein